MSQPSQPSPDQAARIARIAALNDRLRQDLCQAGRNHVVMTRGVAALIDDVSSADGFRKHAALLRQVQTHDSFDADNDPFGEHDFGRFAFEGAMLYWKIDYYDRALAWGSPDPANPDVTTRVLTIMLAEEY